MQQNECHGRDFEAFYHFEILFIRIRITAEAKCGDDNVCDGIIAFHFRSFLHVEIAWGVVQKNSPKRTYLDNPHRHSQRQRLSYK